MDGVAAILPRSHVTAAKGYRRRGHAHRASDLMSPAELRAFAERILCVADDVVSETRLRHVMSETCLRHDASEARQLLLWEDLLHRAARYLILAERKEAEAAAFIAAGRAAAALTAARRAVRGRPLDVREAPVL